MGDLRMGAPLYFLILCAATTSPMPCPGNQTSPQAYQMTREQCLEKMQRYLAVPEYKNYDAYCIRWGGSEVIDHKGRVSSGTGAKLLVADPGDYARAESARAQP